MSYNGPVPQGKIIVGMYTGAPKGKVNVKTVNLHAQGIVLIHTTKDGQRVTRAIHHASGIEGEGRNDQEAYEELTNKLDTEA